MSMSNNLVYIMVFHFRSYTFEIILRTGCIMKLMAVIYDINLNVHLCFMCVGF